MSSVNALEKYTKAMERLEGHIDDNKKIFDDHQKLVFDVMDAENELRDSVAEEKAPVSNDVFRVTIEPQTQVIFDEEKTLQALKVSREGAIAAGVLLVNQRPDRITIHKNK